MGPAGRDKRVRARVSKRRTTGQRNESSGEVSGVSEQETQNFEPASSSRGPDVEPCTRPQQTAPPRKRGRTQTCRRTHLDSRYSLLELVTVPLATLVFYLVNLGFLASAPEAGSCRCTEDQNPK